MQRMHRFGMCAQEIVLRLGSAWTPWQLTAFPRPLAVLQDPLRGRRGGEGGKESGRREGKVGPQVLTEMTSLYA